MSSGGDKKDQLTPEETKAVEKNRFVKIKASNLEELIDKMRSHQGSAFSGNEMILISYHNKAIEMLATELEDILKEAEKKGRVIR